MNDAESAYSFVTKNSYIPDVILVDLMGPSQEGLKVSGLEMASSFPL